MFPKKTYIKEHQKEKLKQQTSKKSENLNSKQPPLGV